MPQTLPELDDFIAAWPEAEENRRAFLRLRDCLAAKPEVTLDFIAREGITYSLRAGHPNQKEKPLFVMVDVIEDQPRWLSVCFYDETVGDPDEAGDHVPEGLLGEDAVCFDVESCDETILAYVEARIEEAYRNAAG